MPLRMKHLLTFCAPVRSVLYSVITVAFILTDICCILTFVIEHNGACVHWNVELAKLLVGSHLLPCSCIVYYVITVVH